MQTFILKKTEINTVLLVLATCLISVAPTLLILSYSAERLLAFFPFFLVLYRKQTTKVIAGMEL